MFALLPIALVVGGYYYVTGGQIMSTDNAYIQADMVGVSTDVSGTVISVDVHENETVRKGQVLFRLKPDSFRIALEGAKAQLGNARNQILNLQASYQQSLAEITQAQADLPYYQTEFDRQQNLITNSVASKAALDQARHNLEAAQQKVLVAKATAAATLAQLGGEGTADLPPEQNPLYLQAKAAVDNAQRELDDTVVKAPFDGVTANVPSLQVGSTPARRKPSSPMFAPARRSISPSTPIRVWSGRERSPASRRHPAPASRFCRRRTRPATGSRSSSAYR